MSTKGPLNIHVTYDSTTSILITTRSGFLKKVCEKFKLKEDEIEIINLKDKRIIGVAELRDIMKIEIRKKISPVQNGMSHSPGPSVSSEPNRNEIVKKLLDNRTLTGRERAFLVDLLEDTCQPPLKRRSVDEPVRPQMKNRKVQVDAAHLLSRRVTYTQTDELINYQPSPNASAAANDIMTHCKRLATADKVDPAVAMDLMTKGFDERRNFILIKRPLARLVKEKYPLLFSNSEVRNELDRIFYDGKCTEFLRNIRKYAPHILSLARDDDPLLLTTRNKVHGFKTVAQKKYAEEIGALLMISSLMIENRDFLKLADKNCEPGDFPYIESQAKLSDLYFDQHIFTIMVEGIKLCEASDFKEAILCLIACFFIFNISYPPETFSTLVTFEKLFLEANDTEESDIPLNVQQIIRSVQLKYQAKSGS